MITECALLTDIFEAGSIYVYKSGHRIEYDGQRSTDVLVEFLLEVRNQTQ